MATRLKKYEFNAQSTSRPKYPWGEWSDGSVWKVRAGTDFTCRPLSFTTTLHWHAKKHGMHVRTQRVNDNEVVFQFYQE